YCKKHHPLMEIIMITGNPELDDAISTVKDGAFDYIAKPFSIDKLTKRVKEAIDHQKEQLIKSLSSDGGNILSKTGAPQIPLPDYQVVRTLGAGTMGIVFLVEKAGQRFALKILRKESNDTNQSLRVKRFLREAIQKYVSIKSEFALKPKKLPSDPMNQGLMACFLKLYDISPKTRTGYQQEYHGCL
ncbi:MAG: response regulator, partial [Candidatus Izemoplasmatales bacterium]|nr:response regulator [Candidatus Izemoplasmatales bacterium]